MAIFQSLTNEFVCERSLHRYDVLELYQHSFYISLYINRISVYQCGKPHALEHVHLLFSPCMYVNVRNTFIFKMGYDSQKQNR